jgi:hypothetical protein
MVSPLDPAEYERRLAADATRAFANHEIRERSEGRWVLQRRGADGRWESTYWTEVLVLRGGKLLVHGDIEHVLFAYYGDSRAPERVLRWMGDCTDLGYYVTQKARIGTGRELIDVDDDRVAAHQIAEELREPLAREVERDGEPWAPPLAEADPDDAEDVEWFRFDRAMDVVRFLAALIDALREADDATGSREVSVLAGGLAQLGRGEPVAEVRRALYDGNIDVETIARLGVVIAPRVFFAHAALRRLCALLDAERATAGEVARG